jgi:D-xylose transport system substrate-binding protein
MIDSVKVEKLSGRKPGGARKLLLLGLVLLLVGSACAPKRQKTGPTRAPLVGFSLDSLVVERWQRDLDVFSAAVKELGADFVYRVADQDAGVQQQQVRELVDLGVDVLVIVPNDADRLTAAVTEVRDRGIAVLSYDRLVRKAGVNLYVSFDNEKVGTLMAAAATQAVPAGSWLILNGAKTDYNAVLLNRGIHSVMDSRIVDGKVSVLGESWPDTWDSEYARKSVEAALGLHKPINAIIAGNDMLAEAAIGVLAENGLAGKVAVIGQDAELAACQRIAEGSQFATIYKPIDRLARRAAECAVELARGEKVVADASIFDGRVEVPFVRLEPTLVTSSLLDATVIRDGFHRAEDVYRNVRR